MSIGWFGFSPIFCSCNGVYRVICGSFPWRADEEIPRTERFFGSWYFDFRSDLVFCFSIVVVNNEDTFYSTLIQKSGISSPSWIGSRFSILWFDILIGSLTLFADENVGEDYRIHFPRMVKLHYSLVIFSRMWWNWWGCYDLSLWLFNVYCHFQTLLRSQHTFGFLYPMRQLAPSLGKVARPSLNFRQSPVHVSSFHVTKSFSLGRLIELLWYLGRLEKLSLDWNLSLINCTVR